MIASSKGFWWKRRETKRSFREGFRWKKREAKKSVGFKFYCFLRRILGVVLHTGERVSCTKKMAFAGSRVMEVVIKQSGGLVWKNWPMNHTRRANAKKRHVRLRQVESVLKACAGPAPSKKTQNCSTESSDSQPSASQ
ncbi:hypothetical protein CY35_17G079200 [Sphagnum magellanicum]|jgi:hypothetical protein|nr:hypothetical protein CY35_17G079200 [Sphagnum magellanicum]